LRRQAICGGQTARGEFIPHSMLAANSAYRNGSPGMTLLSFFGLVPALFGMAAQGPSEQSTVSRVIIREEVILRIPIRPRVSQRIEWAELKGPKCLQANHIAGAMLSGPSSIDFVLRNRQRVRAVMDSECPALDFYDRFYFQLSDERICAKREEIRSRVGGSCRIERFRLLVPQLKQVKR
jgi:hypothetical protein